MAAELHTDFPERLAERRLLFALDEGGRRRQLELESHWPHKGGVVLKFGGVDTISLAEALVGCEIQVPRAERVPLPQGQAYVSDLLGCVLFDLGRGARIGVIEDVQFGAGEAPLLVVRTGSRELLLPFAAEYLENLDVAQKRVEMWLPEGLLDLDAPLTPEEKKHQQGG